jgi:hypothetical protein
VIATPVKLLRILIRKKIKERMHQQAEDFTPDKKRILRRKDVLIFLLNFG